MSAPATAYSAASVVIPTFNRLGVLPVVLAELERQRRGVRCSIEIVVVDDGSSDGTWEWLRRRRWGGEVVTIRQTNAGPARARNRGVAEAGGELVLFLGDDTVPEPGWLVTHLEEHRIHTAAGSIAVIGYTTFPAGDDSPFLRWINEFGAQFGYLLIDDPRQAPFNFFYTSNVSLPRQVFMDLGGFREDFPAAAWEDIEFAYRATEQGLRLRYQPRARVIHHHRISPRTFCRRQRTSGRSGAIFAQLHPELEHFLGVHTIAGSQSFAAAQQRVLEGLVLWAEGLPGLLPRRLYQRLLDIPYRRGLAEGLQELGRR